MQDGRRAQRAIVCDFDGTITLLDTAEYLLDRYAEGDWRAPDVLLLQGSIGLEECMNRQLAMVHVRPEEMLRALDGRVVVRNGLKELVGLCASEGIPFHVASAGLDFVIHHYLDLAGVSGEVQVHAPESEWKGGLITLRFPRMMNPEARTFKDDVVLSLKRQRREVVYIGDGLSDLDGARAADVRYVVRDRPLARLLAAERLEARPFDDFVEIAESMNL